jgi:hypothetical protein
MLKMSTPASLTHVHHARESLVFVDLDDCICKEASFECCVNMEKGKHLRRDWFTRPCIMCFLYSGVGNMTYVAKRYLESLSYMDGSKWREEGGGVHEVH